MSDLRESGCISYTNAPYGCTTDHKASLSVAIIDCYRKLYRSKTENCSITNINKKQYVYSIKSYKTLSLRTTHNHKVLTSQGWKKTDQIKRRIQQHAKLNSRSKNELIIEINRFTKIKLTEKEKVYDIVLREYSNFLTGNHIVHNSIEQDADLVLMLYQNFKEDNENKIDIVIAKHRNGPVGSFQLLFCAETCKFSNIQDTSLTDIY